MAHVNYGLSRMGYTHASEPYENFTHTITFIYHNGRTGAHAYRHEGFLFVLNACSGFDAPVSTRELFSPTAADANSLARTHHQDTLERLVCSLLVPSLRLGYTV